MEEKKIIIETKNFEFNIAIPENDEEAFELATKKEFGRDIISLYYLQPTEYRFEIKIHTTELIKFFAFLRHFTKSQGITTIKTKDTFSTKSIALS